MSHLQMESEYPLVNFKKRSDIHWLRKVWHLTTVSAIAIGFSYLPFQTSISLLVVAWLLFVPLDFWRQKSSAVNELLIHLFRPIMRDSEKNSWAGTSYLLTGVLLIAVIFPTNVVKLSLWFLAFADPVASYFGIRYGRDKIFGQKSLQGSLAAFLVCTIVTAVFLNLHSLLADRVLVFSLIGGLIGALSELIPIGNLDDNLTLPILSSVFLTLLFFMFSIINL